MATNTIDVYVKMPSCRNFEFNMIATSTVAKLCHEIGTKEGIDQRRIRLKYQGKILKRTSTLYYLGVRPETILKAEVSQIRQLNITIEDAGTSTEIEICNLDTVSELVNEAGKYVDISNKILQTANGTTVIASSTVTVEELGLSDGAVLTITDYPKVKVPETKTGISEEKMNAIKSSFISGGKNVEVAFSFDTTGSMYSVLDMVRHKLKTTCDRLIADIPNIRISLIAHGDYCDQLKYVIRMVDLTSNVQELVSFANDVPRTGGGDNPECYEWVLRKAQTLDWAEDSAKALVMIGDYYPHPSSYTNQHIDWNEELDILIGMGVKVYGVHAGGSNEVMGFYQELANRSGGCYLPLKHFDVITEMFLAVCYRESNEHQLNDFVQEIVDAGEMTSDKQEIFKQLKTATKPREKLAASIFQDRPLWWNDTNSNQIIPSYYYDVKTDRWSSVDDQGPVSSFKQKVKKRSCIVM